MNDGLAQFKLSYEISPIILTGGIASNLPGGLVPIISLLQPQDFSQGLGQPADDSSLDNYLAHFSVMPGDTLIENELARYPYANNRVAANAIIVEPLRVSLLMTAPAPGDGGYTGKLVAFTSLQQQIFQHCIQGGTFTVATPAFIFTDCVLKTLRDVSSGETFQVQTKWQWDFEQPLLTLAAAQAAQNSWMTKAGAGQQMNADASGSLPWSSPSNTTGQPSSGAGPGQIPAAQPTGGANSISLFNYLGN